MSDSAVLSPYSVTTATVWPTPLVSDEYSSA
jgi:hypothetical protein